MRELGHPVTRAAILTALFVFLHAPAVSAGGAWLYEIAAADTGVAGAGRAASALDASTAFTNPAGMIALERSELAVGLQPLVLDM